MSKEIRIVKSNIKTAYGIGGFNSNWEPSDVLAAIPLTTQYVTVKDGYVGNIPYVIKETGAPVPAEALLKELVKSNRKTLSINASGSHQKNQYGPRWFVDYEPELEELFTELNIPIPADRRTVFQKAQDFVMGGLVRRGLAEPEQVVNSPVPPGQAALEAARAEQGREELDVLKKQMADLMAQNKKLQEDLKPVAIPEVKKIEKVKEDKKVKKEPVNA